jgi:DNA topoisomerase VI subunit B
MILQNDHAPRQGAQAERRVFTTSRLSEYFSVKELTAQIGCGPDRWRVALAKELIDNSLDACEAAGVAPVVDVGESLDDEQEDALVVEDNGPGIPPEVVAAALDYSTRTSSNSKYVGPTRGQLGNALKCVFAAPAVLYPGEGRGVTVESRGVRHHVVITHDAIAERPSVRHDRGEGEVKNGARIVLPVGGEACCLGEADSDDFYHGHGLAEDHEDVETLARSFAFFNPHAEIRLFGDRVIPLGPAPIRKWGGCDPTSTHWYDVRQLSALAAAIVHAERQGEGEKRGACSVRDFVRQFDGLTGSARAKAVLEQARLSGVMLEDLAGEGGMDEGAMGRLLAAMRANSKPPYARRLGWIGRERAALALWLLKEAAEESDVRYHRVAGETREGRPFAVEAAFAVTDGDGPRAVRYGMNWTPSLSIDPLHHALEAGMIDRGDPVSLSVHVLTPLIAFADRGKRRAVLPREIADAVVLAVEKVTPDWRKLKRRKARDEQVSRREAAEASRPRKQVSIKEASWRVMPQAHAQVVGSRVGAPAGARQVMYAARKLALPITGGKWCKRSSTFTQRHLPEYLENHPEQTAGWNVVFDKRGELIEPHDGRRIGLGTVEVRDYIRGLTNRPPDGYRFVLMIEKAGFEELLEHLQIADRFDLALAWTKGMTTTACRELIDGLSGLGVTTLLLHDFDKAGLSIAHTCRHDSKRYRFRNKPLVLDLGLSLADARAMGLDGEEVEYVKCKKDPRILLESRGVSEEERNYLVSGQKGPRTWTGRRVELNELTIDQFAGFLERKLDEAGVRKVVPPLRQLEDDFASAWRKKMVERRIAEARRLAEAEVAALPVPVPDELGDLVTQRITGTTKDWRAGLGELVGATMGGEKGGAS